MTVRDVWQQGSYVKSFNTTDDIYHVWEVDGKKYTYSASAASEAAIGNNRPAYLLEEVFSN